ncbi:hypothetical protein FOTG_18845 [Fusarium oxysporum f. sp. vasinfectum 25433]|uniref:Uncharacterized protein n=1 Tax=Fusarium oxysporum f. sp. vasinfectum 25433 TaxID=1089449 RepID=X0LVZ7_FUSOX|nr:hypothetical protein FOTG_18845 [Fusarium oxysporum f. sp. vasinfectum 25433]
MRSVISLGGRTNWRENLSHRMTVSLRSFGTNPWGLLLELCPGTARWA